MPIPQKHLDIFNRHLNNAIVEGTVEGGAYAFRIGVRNLGNIALHNVQEALSAAVDEIAETGQAVPRVKWGPTTVRPTK